MGEHQQAVNMDPSGAKGPRAQDPARPILRVGKRLERSRIENGELMGQDRFLISVEGSDPGLLHRIRRIQALDAVEAQSD